MSSTYRHFDRVLACSKKLKECVVELGGHDNGRAPVDVRCGIGLSMAGPQMTKQSSSPINASPRAARLPRFRPAAGSLHWANF